MSEQKTQEDKAKAVRQNRVVRPVARTGSGWTARVFPRGVQLGGPGLKVLGIVGLVMVVGVIWWLFVPDGTPASAASPATPAPINVASDDDAANWLNGDHGVVQHVRRRNGGDRQNGGDYALAGDDPSASATPASSIPTPPPAQDELPPSIQRPASETVTPLPYTPPSPAVGNQPPTPTCANGKVPDFGGNCGTAGPSDPQRPAGAAELPGRTDAQPGTEAVQSDSPLIVAVADASAAPAGVNVQTAIAPEPVGAAASTNGARLYDRRPPATPFVLQRGTDIPLVLNDDLTSEVASGTVSAHVQYDVCDSVSGAYELIPQNARADLTMSQAQVAQGQSRMLVSLRRIYFPDGTSTDVPLSAAADVNGMAGLGGKVDNHTGSILLATAIGAVLSAGAQIAATPQGATSPSTVVVTQNPSAAQSAASAAGGAISQTASKIIDQKINQPPTIYVHRGERFLVKAAEDIHFAAPWGLCHPH